MSLEEPLMERRPSDKKHFTLKSLKSNHVSQETLKEHLKKKTGLESSVFWKRGILALSMGFWITVFFYPICSKAVHKAMFEKGGYWYENVTKPIQENANDMEGYWPNVVQLMFFTVYFTTGSTVQLAWQGGIGTLVAGLNQLVMGQFFPVGGLCLSKPDEGHRLLHLSGLRNTCLNFAGDNSTLLEEHPFALKYSDYQWLVWLDVFLFIFLVLASNAQTNTQKFALSWHSFYMMAFMGRGGYLPSMSVNVTSLIGLVLAILITLVQKSNIAYTRLSHHPPAIAESIRKLVSGAVQMFNSAPTDSFRSIMAKKFELEAVCSSIPSKISAFKGDLADSWWEVFNLGPSKPFRSNCSILCEAFDDQEGGLDDVMYAMMKAVHSEVPSLYDEMSEQELKDTIQFRERCFKKLDEVSMKIGDLVVRIMAKDGMIMTGKLPEEEYVKDLMKLNEELKKLYFPLINQGLDNPTKAREQARNNANVLVFSVMCMVHKLENLYKSIDETIEGRGPFSATGLTLGEMYTFCTTVLFKEFIDTWNLSYLTSKKVTDSEKKWYAVRNSLSISICFVLGNVLNTSVYAEFSPTMPSTLAVLVSFYPGAAFVKNLQRLLAISLGKVLPIIVMASVSLVSSERSWGMHDTSLSAHLLAIFLYSTIFSYIYYTSAEWGYVGCLVAGFGCYGLVSTDDSQRSYMNHYKEIGMVTSAILVQTFVDVTDTLLRAGWPRDVILNNTRKLGMDFRDENQVPHGLIVKVFQEFFKVEKMESPAWATMLEHIQKAKKTLAIQATMLGDCAPKNQVALGSRVPFRYDFYHTIQNLLVKLLAEAELLILVNQSGISQKEVEWNLIRDAFQGELMFTLKRALSALQTVLEQRDEADMIQLLPGPEYKRTGPIKIHTFSVRLNVAARACTDALTTALEILRTCYSTGCFESLPDEVEV